jgi:hypothetical protein
MTVSELKIPGLLLIKPRVPFGAFVDVENVSHAADC